MQVRSLGEFFLGEAQLLSPPFDRGTERFFDVSLWHKFYNR